MTLYVNSSLLRLLNDCETRTWIRWGQERVMRVPEAPGPMEAGRVLHRVFEKWMNGESKGSILWRFDTLIDDEYKGVSPLKERFFPENLRLIIGHWLDEQELKPRDFNVVHTEQTVEAPLGKVGGEDIIYYGTVDSLIEWKGELYLLDHKTTGSLDEDWTRGWSMSAQMQGYVWLLRQLGYPVKGAFINGLEVRKLPPWNGDMTKKCGTHKLKYSECQPLHVKSQWIGPLWWSENRLAQWHSDVMMLVRKLMHLRSSAASPLMDGQFKWPGCKRCPYMQWCSAGRPLAGLDQMMVRSSWRQEEEEDANED